MIARDPTWPYVWLECNDRLASMMQQSSCNTLSAHGMRSRAGEDGRPERHEEGAHAILIEQFLPLHQVADEPAFQNSKRPSSSGMTKIVTCIHSTSRTLDSGDQSLYATDRGT